MSNPNLMFNECSDCGNSFRIGDYGNHKCSKSLLKKRQKARLARLAVKNLKEQQSLDILKELRAIKKLLQGAEREREIKRRAEAGL